MSVLSETLFTLVRGHFVLLSFLSAWHSNVLILSARWRMVNKKFILNLSDKSLL
jgi:hypothetical protein